MTQPFDRLTPEERAVVGDPQDYDWENPITPEPAPRPARDQFSMRVDPDLYADLATAAASRGIRFSELVREALETYVGRRQAATGLGSYTLASVATFRVTENAGSWGPATRASLPELLRDESPEQYRVPVTR